MFGNGTKRALTKRGIKKIDAVVTGLILGGIIASIYGIKKSEECREKRVQPDETGSDSKHSVPAILKMLVFGVKTVEKKPENSTLWGRISSIFR